MGVGLVEFAQHGALLGDPVALKCVLNVQSIH
jgi:hypothetical protein